MPRTFKSPTRTISNRGEHPRFVGLLSSPKASSAPSPWLAGVGHGVMPYDSVSALICAIHLEWRKDVESFAFELRAHEFVATDLLAALRCVPDFEVVWTTGEIAPVEAKYAREDLRKPERERLELARQHFAAAGLTYEVVYRKDLEVDGFADTVFLLRQYGLLPYPERVLVAAEKRLSPFGAASLGTWRSRAADVGVSVAVLYKLLYLERLPLEYQPLQFVELDKWHA